ncbi:MAG: hypothetical protein ACYC3Q_14415 [Gemmatimonadaceae bacterium]
MRSSPGSIAFDARRRPALRLAAALLLPALLAACGDRMRSADDELAGRVAEAVPAIEKATGLKFKTPPKYEARTKDQVREFLLKKLAEENPAQQVANEERALKLFGLIPDTLDLKKLFLALYTEQIVGFYDPATKTLYVVKDAPKDLLGVTVSHELVHALQDQYINLDSLYKANEAQPDRQLAVQAVIEGQATYEQMSAMLGGDANIAARLPGGWDKVREMIREAQGSMPVFATSPTVVQETLIFPYLSGAEFVRRFESERPGQDLLKDLPTSTEQLLETKAFFGTPKDDPTIVTLPAPRGATSDYDSQMGEFGTRILVYEHVKDQNIAFQAAQGWDGDRYMLLRTPRGAGVAWLTVWDTPMDAAEFADALGEATLQRYGGTPAKGTTPDLRTYNGGGRSVAIRNGEVGGRTVVLWVDVPLGASTDVLDLKAVTLK